MEIVLLWFGFAFIVAIAAGSRGRSGAGWFMLAVIISPLIALIVVLVMPNLRNEELLRRHSNGGQLQSVGPGGQSTRVSIDRSPQPFEPDGVYAGVPYKVNPDGSIHAIMQGATVKFRDFDKFVGALA